MALPSLASLEELTRRLGVALNEAEQERAQAALDDASALIRAEAATTWTDTADPPTLANVPAIVESITLSVARRAYENPSAHADKRVDDISVTYDRRRGEGAVYLTSAERRAVRKAAGVSGVSTIELEGAWPFDTTVYVPVEGGGDLMPWYVEPGL